MLMKQLYSRGFSLLAMRNAPAKMRMMQQM